MKIADPRPGTAGEVLYSTKTKCEYARSSARAPRSPRRKAVASRTRHAGTCCSPASPDPRPTSRRTRAGGRRSELRDRARRRTSPARARTRRWASSRRPRGGRPRHRRTRGRRSRGRPPSASSRRFAARAASSRTSRTRRGATTVTSCDADPVEASDEATPGAQPARAEPAETWTAATRAAPIRRQAERDVPSKRYGPRPVDRRADRAARPGAARSRGALRLLGLAA